jgi:hypothetical protein
VGEGHKSGVRRTNLVLLPPALALCPDLARGENQMSTSTDNNACYFVRRVKDPPHARSYRRS